MAKAPVYSSTSNPTASPSAGLLDEPMPGDQDELNPLFTFNASPAWGERSPPTPSVGHTSVQGCQDTNSNICQQSTESTDTDISETSSLYPRRSKACHEWIQRPENPKAGGTVPCSSAAANRAYESRMKAAALREKVIDISGSPNAPTCNDQKLHHAQQGAIQHACPSNSAPEQSQRQQNQSLFGALDIFIGPSPQNRHSFLNVASYPSFNGQENPENQLKTPSKGVRCLLSQTPISTSSDFSAIESATRIWANEDENADDKALRKHQYSPQQRPLDDSKRLRPNENRQTSLESSNNEPYLVFSFQKVFVFPVVWVFQNISLLARGALQYLTPYESPNFFKDLDYDSSYDKYIDLSESHTSPSFQNKVSHGPWKKFFKADEFPNNLMLSSASHRPSLTTPSFSSSSWLGPRGSEYSDTNLWDLPVAPWCGTDLVGHPSEWHGQTTQARKEDDCHRVIEGMSKNQQWLRTRRVPRLRKKLPQQDPNLSGEETHNRAQVTHFIPERSSAARLTSLKTMYGGQGISSPKTRLQFIRGAEFPPDLNLSPYSAICNIA